MFLRMGLLLRLGPNVITDGTFITLGSNQSNYYTCAFYSCKGCTDLESFTATSAVRYKSQTSPLQKCWNELKLKTLWQLLVA